MTLQEWSDKYGILPTSADGKRRVSAVVPCPSAAYNDVHKLTDYNVSERATYASKECCVVYLSTRKPAYRLEVNTGGGWVQTATSHTSVVSLIQLAIGTLRATNDVLAVRVVDREGMERLHLGLLEI